MYLEASSSQSTATTYTEVLHRIRRCTDPSRGITFVDNDGKNEEFWPYAELGSKIACAGTALKSIGLKQGNRAGLILLDNRDFARCFLGALYVGILPVAICHPSTESNWESYIEKIHRIISTSRCSLLIVSPEIEVQFKDLGERLGVEIRSVDELKYACEEASPAVVSPRMLAYLQFTSGSTSNPRGAAITHENLLTNTRLMQEYSLFDDKYCSWLPLYHDLGLVGFLLSPLVTITAIVLLPTSLFMRHPMEWLRQISKHKATISFAPNSAYALLAKRVQRKTPSGLDLSSWRGAGCGGEPIHASTLEFFAERFSCCGFRHQAFFPVYGMAESTLAVTFPKVGMGIKKDIVSRKMLSTISLAVPTSANKNDAQEIVCCGKALPGHTVEILRPDGSVCIEREVGEIAISGPSVMPGYYNNAQANREAFKEAKFLTGDLGYLACEELYVCGRKKELLTLSERNYFPADIEQLVSEVEGVRQGNCVVFSVFDKQLGKDSAVLCAEVKASKLHCEDLKKAIYRTVLSKLGLSIDYVLLVGPKKLLKTTSGKPKRRRIRELYQRGALEIGLPGKSRQLEVNRQRTMIGHRTGYDLAAYTSDEGEILR